MPGARDPDPDRRRIYTLGHSTRSLAVFVGLLHAHGVVQVADVRSRPASRRQPHFARAHLEAARAPEGIAYRWMPALGGLRQPAPAEASPHRAWRDPGLRAYADAMLTQAFAAARAELERWARARPTAVVGAEASYRRCHRQLLADALLCRGWDVLHIESRAPARPHAQRARARLRPDGQVVYPGDPELALG